MATYIRTICTFPHNTGLPEDAVVNTWAWIYTGAGTRDSAATTIETALNGFYGAIKAYLSGQYAWNSGTYEMVDMADGKPRVPYSTKSAALGALSTAAYDFPHEVAVCLSFRGARASGLNAARRRGRVYVGPLQAAALDQVNTGTTMADLIANSGRAMNTAAAASDVTHAIYSPYTHHDVPVGERLRDDPPGTPVFPENPAKLDDSFVPVETYWCDNAWDVQRRRGPKATYRKTA